MNSNRYSSSDNELFGRNWLDHLRNNSWEMELLITGFVLVGLFQVPDLLVNLKSMMGLQVLSSFARNSVGAIWRMLDTSVKVIIINLVLQLILRGYWVGMIGLDSTLRDKSDRSAGRRLQRSIRKLDDVCSVMFALTFLIVFITIASSVFMIYWSLLAVVVNIPVPAFMVIPYRVISVTLFILITIFGVLKAVDFLTLGKVGEIKRNWFSVPFHFVSRWMGYLTLGFLARQIYELLKRSLPNKRFRAILILYIVVIVVIFAGIRVDNRTFFPISGNQYMINPNEYEDQVTRGGAEGSSSDGRLRMWTLATIQSELITEPYLRLYIPYSLEDDQSIADSLPGVEPFHKSIFMEYISINLSQGRKPHKAVLDFFERLYQVTIDDTIHCDCEFRYYRFPNEQEIGFLTYIPLSGIPNGLHEVTIGKGSMESVQVIPFWLMREGQQGAMRVD